MRESARGGGGSGFKGRLLLFYVACARAGGGGGGSGHLAAYSQEVATKTGRINDNIFTGYSGRWDGSNHGT